MKNLYYVLSDDNFDHLITNRTTVPRAQNEIHEVPDTHVLRRVYEYIEQVEIGDGKKSYCPFVRMIHKKNGYFVQVFSNYALHAGGVIEELERAFKVRSPKKTQSGQYPDPVTIVAAFPEDHASSAEFCHFLEQTRNEWRQHFLDQGLMIAYMHPFHVLGSAKEGSEENSEKLYVAQIPLLMVRRMHKEDHVFMHTAEEIAAYEKYFGKVKKNSCPYHAFIRMLLKCRAQFLNLLKYFRK